MDSNFCSASALSSQWLNVDDKTEVEQKILSKITTRFSIPIPCSSKKCPTLLAFIALSAAQSSAQTHIHSQ